MIFTKTDVQYYNFFKYGKLNEYVMGFIHFKNLFDHSKLIKKHKKKFWCSGRKSIKLARQKKINRHPLFVC